MPKPSSDEIAAAHARLATEVLYPLFMLAPEFGVTSKTLERWVMRGRSEMRLDGIQIEGVWHTSREAIARFNA